MEWGEVWDGSGGWVLSIILAFFFSSFYFSLYIPVSPLVHCVPGGCWRALPGFGGVAFVCGACPEACSSQLDTGELARLRE